MQQNTTACSGAADRMSRHNASAASSSGRTFTRVEIFSEKTRVHPAARNATNWLSKREVQPRSEAQIEEMREMFSGIPEPDEAFYESLRQGWQGRRLNNEGYRLHLPDTGSNPFENLGKAGHEAASRELMRLGEELDQREGK